MIKRKIFGIIVICLCLCVTSPVMAEEKTLTLAFESDPTNIDPRFGTDVNSARVYQVVSNGLIKKDPTLNLVPDLAERWENPDDTTYIFYLRKGVKFHDGSEFTAEDVKYTFESILDPEMNSPKASPYKRLLTFHLNLDVYVALKKAGLPEEVLMKLTELGDVDYIKEEELVEAVKEQLGEEQAETYQAQIVKHARKLGIEITDPYTVKFSLNYV